MFQILVVKDDRDLNRSVCSFLNQCDYAAIGCLDANAAYDAMYDTVFDLIVSDIMMPDIDGFEVVKTVRSLNENTPFLFMTTRDDFAAKQRGYRVGIDDYMVKPVDLDELFLRNGALLRRPNEDEEQRQEYSAAVSASATQVADLISNILKLTKLENQQIYPRREKMDMGEQQRECLLQFEEQWEAKELDMQVDIADDVIIRSDGQLLSVVWNNLISCVVDILHENITVECAYGKGSTFAVQFPKQP